MNYFPYMPVLKFRQAEYQALLRLDETIKHSLLPMFIVPPIEYDFEEQRLKKTAVEHVSKLPQRLKDKWGKGTFLLDIDESLHPELLADGSSLILDIYNSILSEGLEPIPVLTLSYSQHYFQYIKDVFPSLKGRLALRVSFDELANPDNFKKLQGYLKELDTSEGNTTLIIDFKDNTDYSESKSICNLLEMICGFWQMERFSSVYVIGTSLDLSQVKKPGDTQEREDWNLYKALCRGSFPISIGFGDYLIETPYFSNVDMRKIKPAAKLVYSYDDYWDVLKGSAFRDNPGQMRSICNDLIMKPDVYCAPTFSPGDKKIYECAHGVGNTGNLGTWKEAALSHHLTLVVNQLSSFFEA